MGKHLDWYLVELQRRSAGRLAADEIHVMCAQTEDHVLNIAAEFERLGMNEEAAELAALERFGALDALVGEEKPKPRRVRANWSAPVAVQLFGITALLFALATSNSYISIVIAAGIAFLCLLLSAILCARRGKMPALIMAGVWMSGFVGMGWFGNQRFLGPEAGFALKTDAPRFAKVLEARQAKLQHIAHLTRLGKLIRHGVIPTELQTPQGVIVPRLYSSFDTWRSYGSTQYQWMFDWDQSKLSPNDGPLYTPWTGMNGVPILTFESDPARAARLWKVTRVRDLETTLQSLGRTLSLLRGDSRQRDENLYGVVLLGMSFTFAWTLLARILNAIANGLAAIPREREVKTTSGRRSSPIPETAG